METLDRAKEFHDKMSGILVRFSQRIKHFKKLLLDELTKGHSALNYWKDVNNCGSSSTPAAAKPPLPGVAFPEDLPVHLSEGSSGRASRSTRSPAASSSRPPLPLPGGTADLGPVSSLPACRPSALPGCGAAGAGAGTATRRPGGRAGRRAGRPTGSRWCRRRGARRRRRRRPRLGASPESRRLRPGARPLRPGLGGAGEAGGPSPGGGCAKAAPGSGPAPPSTCRAPHAAPERPRPRRGPARSRP